MHRFSEVHSLLPDDEVSKSFNPRHEDAFQFLQQERLGPGPGALGLFS